MPNPNATANFAKGNAENAPNDHAQPGLTTALEHNGLAPEFLVVAYTDNGSTPGVYDAGDTLIAGILDTNGEPGLNVGDAIVFGSIPTSFDGTGPHEIEFADQTVAAVIPQLPSQVGIETSGGFFIFAGDNDQFNAITYDHILITDPSQSGSYYNIQDVLVGAADRIEFDDTSGPQSAIFQQSPGDQSFLNVDFLF